MGRPSPSHQWDVHRLDLFLLTLPWARGTNISPRTLHRPLLLHDLARQTKAWLEVEDMAHKPGLKRPRGVSTPSYLKMRLQISRLFRVHFFSFAFRQEYYLIMVHHILLLLHHVWKVWD